MLLETVLIAFVGAAVGGVIGSLSAWYFVVFGLDLGVFTSSGDMNLDMMGMSFSQVVKFAFEPSFAFTPMLVLVPFAVLCGLWPAIQAARIDIVRELNGRN